MQDEAQRRQVVAVPDRLGQLQQAGEHRGHGIDVRDAVPFDVRQEGLRVEARRQDQRPGLPQCPQRDQIGRRVIERRGHHDAGLAVDAGDQEAHALGARALFVRGHEALYALRMAGGARGVDDAVGGGAGGRRVDRLRVQPAVPVQTRDGAVRRSQAIGLPDFGGRRGGDRDDAGQGRGRNPGQQVGMRDQHPWAAIPQHVGDFVAGAVPVDLDRVRPQALGGQRGLQLRQVVAHQDGYPVLGLDPQCDQAMRRLPCLFPQPLARHTVRTDDQFFKLIQILLHFLPAPAASQRARTRSISGAVNPALCKTSSVCSPSRGARQDTPVRWPSKTRGWRT